MTSRFLHLTLLTLSIFCLTCALSAPLQANKLQVVNDEADDPPTLEEVFPVDDDVAGGAVNPDEPKAPGQVPVQYLQNKSNDTGVVTPKKPDATTLAPEKVPDPTRKPDPAPKGSSSSILFGVVVAIVLLMLGCLLYFMFFGSSKDAAGTEQSMNRQGGADEPANQQLQSRKSSTNKSPVPADPQLTVRSTTGVPSTIVPPAAAAAAPQAVPQSQAAPVQQSTSSQKLVGTKSTKSILKPASGRKSKA